MISSDFNKEYGMAPEVGSADLMNGLWAFAAIAAGIGVTPASFIFFHIRRRYRRRRATHQ